MALADLATVGATTTYRVAAAFFARETGPKRLPSSGS